MDAQFAKAFRDSLVWFPDKGYGYFPVTTGDAPYDEAYFHRYAQMADTEIGRKLNQFRVEWVNRFTKGLVLDVGIGSGTFIEQRNASGRRTLGYDVNPAGARWLKERELWWDWREASDIHALTLFDVLEHMDAPHELLAKVSGFAFITLPIFEDAQHVLRSKHLKKDEHQLYFSRHGFYRWAEGYGFKIVDETWRESNLGREDICSFVLKR